MSIFQKIHFEIKTFQKILILGHKKPDADCIGSQQALGLMLRKIYPEKIVLTPYDYERVKYLDFLKTENTLINSKKNFDEVLIILVDCDQLARTDYPNIKAKKIVVIDHHKVEKKSQSELSWIEEDRSSCAEMILELFLKWNWKINLDIATLLYCGMISDNGNFTYQKVSKRSFELATKLMEHPIPLRKMNYQINKITRKDFEIKKFIMNNLEWNEKYVIFRFFPEDKKKIDISSDYQLTRHINLIKNTEHLKFWIFFIQWEETDVINCSLRSQDNFDVRAIAKKFGGGGHLNAAGVKLKSRKMVEFIIKEALKQLERNE